MSRLVKFAALLLLALWLPATLHCRLEGAGLELRWLGCHDHDASAAEHCADSTCHAVEEAAYSKVASALRNLPPPSLPLLFCLLHLQPSTVATDSSACSAAEGPPELQALRRTWQFVHRTALPARAPDALA